MSQLATIAPVSSPDQGTSENYDYFQVKPINGGLGAELRGINLADVPLDGAFEEIHGALMRHQVIVFRGQTLDPARLIEIGRQFGELNINPFVAALDGYPEIMPVRSEENREKQFTGLWHSDLSWAASPSMASLLYAVEVPAFGGDTLFTNMYTALSSLSAGMQSMLAALQAEHRVDRYHSARAEEGTIPEDGVLHPVVTTHPVTGRKVLFVNEYFTRRFANMSEQESAPLLQYLYRHSARPDFSCRIQWEPGTLLVWDNRCTQHYATNDYPDQKRLMYRLTVDGDVPL